MNPIEQFKQECFERIKLNGQNDKLLNAAKNFVRESTLPKYSYNFTWLSRPIIQYPQDIVAVQEIIWQVKPDMIIETGIAHGGSLILNASMLALLDLVEVVESGTKTFDPRVMKRKVLGIDIDIRAHNKKAIETHPLFNQIQMVEGSSIAREIIDQVYEIAHQYNRIMVLLDSMHTHQHVLEELEAYTPLVSSGSYCVVFDTIIEDMPEEMFLDRPWGRGNNPKTAVWQFLKTNDRFEIDKEIENKLLITVAPNGYLRCVK